MTPSDKESLDALKAPASEQTDPPWAWHFSLTAIDALQALQDLVPEELRDRVREARMAAWDCLDWARAHMPQFRETVDSSQNPERPESRDDQGD